VLDATVMRVTFALYSHLQQMPNAAQVSELVLLRKFPAVKVSPFIKE